MAHDDARFSRTPTRSLLITLILGLSLVGCWLATTLGTSLRDPNVWLSLLFQPEIGPFALWLVVGPAVALWRMGNRTASATMVGPATRALLFVVALVAGFGVSAWFGHSVRSMPAAYHDEDSYLLQAETFLAGRWSLTPPPASRHFDQMHVLNDHGVFASRYFPGTGYWLAPFVAFGVPHASGWVAHAIAVAFLALSACRVSIWSALLVTGLAATSPILVVLSNTLLSVTPTVMCVSVGWWGMTAFLDSRRVRFAAVLGLAVGAAFLTRPVTAVALAGPWAAYLAWIALRSDDSVKTSARRGFIAAGIAFAPAVLLLALFNQSLTGRFWVTPYGEYTATYSPSHVYGFYNRTRGQSLRTERTIVAYDDWAPELTPATALVTSRDRWDRLVPWSVGLVPCAFLLGASLLAIGRLGDRQLIPLVSIASLSLAHVPFAFPGIFGCSYIVESTPLLVFVLGSAAGLLTSELRQSGRPRLANWWASLVGVAVAVNLFGSIPAAFDPASEWMYPRWARADRLAMEERLAPGRELIILYGDDRRNDIHGSWVVNPPTFDSRILRGWLLNDPKPVMDAYPERAVFVEESGRYRVLRP